MCTPLKKGFFTGAGYDNGRGIDPDRFVNIHNIILEFLDCLAFVLGLEREDIHAVFCGGEDVRPLYLPGLEIQLIGFVTGYHEGVTVDFYFCKDIVGLLDSNGCIVEILLKVRSGVLIDINAQDNIGRLVPGYGIGGVEIGNIFRSRPIVPDPAL